MIEVSHAVGAEQLDQVRALIRAFLQWHRERHAEDQKLIEQYFDASSFERELDSLPGGYGPPTGCLLLASYDRQPAGCVALHALDGAVCEMKRMFVYPRFHGKGIGRTLAKSIIDEARLIGYATMRLDTSLRQLEAQRLYEGLGFQRVKAYYPLPKELESWLIFMELDLRAA